MSMLSPLEREQVGDRLREQAAVLRLLGQELMRSLGEAAGRMALTEDEVVRVHEEIARCGDSVVAAQALEHAERARLFAEHERREQQRWSTRGEEDRHLAIGAAGAVDGQNWLQVKGVGDQRA
jgi:hypothetical protein